MRDQGYAYLDVRTVPEFDAGHPEHAYNIPWLEQGPDGMRANTAFVEQVSARFQKQQKLIVGCKGVTRAEQAAEALREAGFVDVILQAAGMDGLTDAFGRTKQPGWRGLGLPVSFEAEPGHSHAALSKPHG